MCDSKMYSVIHQTVLSSGQRYPSLEQLGPDLRKRVRPMLNINVLGSLWLKTQRTARSGLIRNTWRYARTPKMVKSEEETSETERSRISEDSQKGSETQKLILHVTYNFHSRNWPKKLKDRKLFKMNTLPSVTEIGGRIAINRSKDSFTLSILLYLSTKLIYDFFNS